MMYPRSNPLLILAVLLFLVDSPAFASCARLRGPRLLDAEVVSCESPRSRAEAGFEKFRAFTGGGAAAGGEIVRGLLEREPARVVTLKVLRYRQFDEDPRQAESASPAPWVEVADPTREAYLLMRVEDCTGYPAGSRRRFLEEFVCCDMIPPQELACLVDLPALVAPPERLRSALDS